MRRYDAEGREATVAHYNSAATEDGAWVSFVYLDPATDEAGGTKHAWVVKRDGLLFGSGWYE